MGKFCTKCGSEIKNKNAKFCDLCGCKINDKERKIEAKEEKTNAKKYLIKLML